jgi:hypothetical protein
MPSRSQPSRDVSAPPHHVVTIVGRFVAVRDAPPASDILDHKHMMRRDFLSFLAAIVCPEFP